MRRFVTAVLCILFALTVCVCASAQTKRLYAEYQARSEHSAVFYIDICSCEPVSAAVIEVAYDGAFALYQDTKAENDTATVYASADQSLVKIAYCDHTAKSGKLCRLSFKAQEQGLTTFTVHLAQATDENLRYLVDVPDHVLTVTLTEEDVAAAASGSTKKDKTAASGERSTVIEPERPDREEPTAPDERMLKDYSDQQHLTYFLLGAGAVLLAVILVGIGFMLGRRKKGPRTKTEEEEPKPEEKIVTPQEMEEISRIIDEIHTEDNSDLE